jgi:hypothetical protein
VVPGRQRFQFRNYSIQLIHQHIHLLGWHWAFLPSFVAKVVPDVDLVPTWTVAVLVATRGTPRQQAKIEPPIIEGRP